MYFKSWSSRFEMIHIACHNYCFLVARCDPWRNFKLEVKRGLWSRAAENLHNSTLNHKYRDPTIQVFTWIQVFIEVIFTYIHSFSTHLGTFCKNFTHYTLFSGPIITLRVFSVLFCFVFCETSGISVINYPLNLSFICLSRIQKRPRKATGRKSWEKQEIVAARNVQGVYKYAGL